MPRPVKTAPKVEPPNSVIASAARVTTRRTKMPKSAGVSQPWQDEGWHFLVLGLFCLFAQADYLQWYWGSSHTTPAPDVGQGFQDDLLLLACGWCVTHHHAGCIDVLMAVPTAK